MTSSQYKILVTGASGFVGRHLLKALSAKGVPVTAIYNSRTPSEELKQLPNITWQQADLLDIFAIDEVMEGITHIYHCAAIVSFDPKHWDEMLHFNVEATANLVNIALENEVQKIIHVSSVAALGRNELKDAEVTEDEQWEESKYNSKYALSKHLAEQEIWRGAGEGLEVAIVNPSVILGEGDWDRGSAKLFQTVDREFPFYTQGINGWVDVKDVVKAMIMLMESDISHERFILNQGNHAYKHIFSMMAEALGKKPPHIAASRFLTALVWRWSVLKNKFTGEENTITKETANTAQKKVFYNNSKLLNQLPEFNYTPIEETIKRMAVAYRAHKQ